MNNKLVVSSAQMGPISRRESRKNCVKRMLEMMNEAKSKGSKFVVFPELTLTSFFPRWFIENQEELDHWFEKTMPSDETIPLFEMAQKYEISFNMGYAEKIIENGKPRYFNTSILVNQKGEICGKYRKIHLPGHYEPLNNLKNQHLEKRYFEKGNLGFPVFDMLNSKVGMLICNDRRWVEAWRVLSLKRAVIVCLGYNTPNDHSGFKKVDELADFHHLLSMQSGSYLNSVWSIGTAKCGNEEGSSLIGKSVIVAPSGQIVAQSQTLQDEVINAEIDLTMAEQYKKTFFDYARHRSPECYRLISEKKSV